MIVGLVIFFFSPEGLSCRSRWRTGQRANFGQFMWRPQQRLPSSESHRTKRGRCLLSLVRLYFLLSRRKTDQNFFFQRAVQEQDVGILQQNFAHFES